VQIAETYSRFQHEQHDADNPERKLNRNLDPHVEGFDQWGPNQSHDRSQFRVEEGRGVLDPNPRLLANRIRAARKLK
jgi:hypothetical protein